MLYMEVSGQSQAPAALPPGERPGAYCIGGCVGHGACLDVLEKEKYLYVPRVEPRIIQLLSVTISFSGYFNAALANVFGENSYRSRAVLVCGCGCGLVCVLR